MIFELLSLLDRARFAPSLLVSKPGGFYLDRLPTDIPVIVLPSEQSLRGRYPLLRSLAAIWRTRPDVVFATQRMILTIGSIAPAFPRGTRLVLRQANDFTTDFGALIQTSLVKHRIAKFLSLACLRRADAVVCQSLAMQADLRRHLGSQTRLHVIGNPVDLDVVARAAAATPSDLPGEPALVSVGRLAPQKGYDVLLPALKLLRAEYPRVHLTICGDGPDREALEQQAQTLAIADAVSFVGFTSTPLPHVRAAKLFVLASRYEGFPNAALEALACGTPVVLTDCPGANAEIVEPGVNGRLAARVEPRAMAAAIAEALGDTYAREAIIDRCRARFAAPQIVARYEELFAAVAGGAPCE